MTEGLLKLNTKTAFFEANLKFYTANQLFLVKMEQIAFSKATLKEL